MLLRTIQRTPKFRFSHKESRTTVLLTPESLGNVNISNLVIDAVIVNTVSIRGEILRYSCKLQVTSSPMAMISLSYSDHSLT